MDHGLQGPVNSLLLLVEKQQAGCEDGFISPSPWLKQDLDGGESLLSYNNVPFLQMLQGAMSIEQHQHFKAKEEVVEEEEQQPILPSYPLPEITHSELLFKLQNQNLKKEPVTLVAEQLDSCVTHASSSNAVPANETTVKERKKRKRAPRSAATTAAVMASPPKSAEEVDSQRRTHIAVERNRRRLMNHHLATLRSIMPPSYTQRGDQASIVGGAIEFVKELEQLLLSLHAEKRSRATAAAIAAAETATSSSCSTPATSSTSPCIASNNNEDEHCNIAVATAQLDINILKELEGFFFSPQYRSYSQSVNGEWGVDVEAFLVHGHVSLKVAGRRRPGQLARAVAALEELRLPVLHITVTSLGLSTVLYSFNLKMEEECKMGSQEEIASAVHQIFVCVNASC